MSQFWNERYAISEYAYGIEPNLFLKEQLRFLNPGKLLLPAEGEGRNAVYAAGQGWDVYAFDSSTEAAKKAQKLADAKNVVIKYNIADANEIPFPGHTFDCVALIFFHLPSIMRNHVHSQILYTLKPGGTLLLEGFSKKQIEMNSGGPRSIDLLFSKKELEYDFASVSNYEIRETEMELNEGLYHQGLSHLIQLIAVK